MDVSVVTAMDLYNNRKGEMIWKKANKSKAISRGSCHPNGLFATLLSKIVGCATEPGLSGPMLSNY